MKKFKTIHKNGQNIKFDESETKKDKLHQNKSPVLINDIDINKIVVFNKLPFYFIYILLPTTIIKKLNLHAYSFQK